MSLLKNWRFVLLTLVAIAALAAFGACGDDDDDDDGGETAAATTPAGGEGERIQGGKLTVHAIEPQSMDPHFSSFAQDISIQRMLWRGLYSLDIDNQPVPSMAAGEPEISEDGLTATVTLQDGILWSDGDDLTAEDFVAGFTRTCNPVNAGQYQYLLSNIVGCDEYYVALAGPDESPGTEDDLDPSSADLASLEAALGVKAIDDTTLEFTFENPWPTFQVIMSLWMTFPLPSHLISDPAADWPAGPDAAGALAFNGPYILTSYTAASDAKLAPNPNWKEEYSPVGEVPTLDEIELRFIDDHAVADRAYDNDELQFALVDLTQLSTRENGDDYKKLVRPSTRGLQMNMEHPPLDNFEVRQAIGNAVDWQEMIDRCYGGGHQYTTSWIPDGVPAGQPPDAFSDVLFFDPEGAKTQLDAAGGVDRELDMVVRQGAEHECAGQFIQESLRANLDLEVKLEAVEGPVRSARFREESFDLFPGGWIQDYPDPENWVQGLFDTNGPLNHYNCSNTELDDLAAQAAFNLDNDERISQYERINEIISGEICGIYNYYHEAEHYLKKDKVVGMYEYSTGQDAVSAGDWAVEAWGVSE